MLLSARALRTRISGIFSISRGNIFIWWHGQTPFVRAVIRFNFIVGSILPGCTYSGRQIEPKCLGSGCKPEPAVDVVTICRGV